MAFQISFLPLFPEEEQSLLISYILPFRGWGLCNALVNQATASFIFGFIF